MSRPSGASHLPSMASDVLEAHTSPPLTVDELSQEQAYVTMLYDRLDNMRSAAQARRADELRATGGTPQARSQRDITIRHYTDQVTQLGAVEDGLCFGRLDMVDGQRRYIGRIGIIDPANDYQPLLLDWRAPAARPFYLATAASNQGVRLRRQLRTRQRIVTGIHDEVLDLDHASPTAHEGLVSEASLLAALDANRTGRMSDIVETIQAEQDHIIRSDLDGALVVQGGPGTGKTAVALHRAAYLLYTHRQELSTRGVLLVGPNATFLRYISEVLPALAETGVLLRTQGELFPGATAERSEPAEVAEIKGRLMMTEVLAAAVRDRQRVPDDALEINIDRETLWLDRQTCLAARERARRCGKPHNLARRFFDIEIIHALAGQIAERIGADPLGGENLLDEADIAEIRRELRAEPEVQAVLDWLWPVLTPQQLLAGLYASPDRLDAAAGQLTDQEREVLQRAPGGGWTPADVPLLDEAAELLGEVKDNVELARLARMRRWQQEYAEGVLDIAAGSRSIDLEDEPEGEILSVTDLLDADRLSQRQDVGEQLTTAQRAAADRNWAFGHLIVDEAQELSPMAWRLLMRRCPSRSMTIVGDVAQTGALGGAESWSQVLAPYVGNRWRLEELTISYRTPAEILAVAGEVLAAINPELRPPRAVRTTGVPPWNRSIPSGGLVMEVVAATAREATAVGEGRLGVIVPQGRIDELATAITRHVSGVAVGADPDLRKQAVVLTVAQAKGLEFDSVLVIDPERIAAESPRGNNDLYVALTRATRRLGILRVEPDPVTRR